MNSSFKLQVKIRKDGIFYFFQLVMRKLVVLLMVVHNPFIFSVLIDALFSECQIGLQIFFSFHACLRILLALLCPRNVRTTV